MVSDMARFQLRHVLLRCYQLHTFDIVLNQI
nr:MAG TPA: hypothetical protein [Caudoviricetes sp.]